MKVRRGDTVVVLTGADRGKTGKITKVLPDSNQVVVEGVNIRTKHRKKTGTQPGGIEKLPMPIHVSNVNPLRPGSKDKASRVGFKTGAKGQKVRVLRQAGNKEIK